MKAVTTAGLLNHPKQDALAKTIKREARLEEEFERKTFTLQRRHIQTINARARQMSDEEERQVFASEALRDILEGHTS